MKSSRIILALMLALASCSPKIVPPSAVSDSVCVVYRDRIINDTVYVEIPLIKESIMTKDTMSYLDNGYAKSEASIEQGILHHSLETIPQKISMPVSIVVHDTAVLASSTKTIEVQVEKEMSPWQVFLVNMGKLALVVLSILIIWIVFKLTIKK